MHLQVLQVLPVCLQVPAVDHMSRPTRVSG
jgi:hypothetical protein